MQLALLRLVTVIGLVACRWIAQGAIVTGRWTGEMTRDGASLPIIIQFSGSNGHLRGDFTAIAQAVMDYPLDSVSQSGNEVDFVLGGGVKFSGKLDKGRLAGSFREGSATGTFSLRRAPNAALPYRVREVRFGSRNAPLAGTLCIPSGPGKHPGIVLLHGSGPQSRWGTLRAVADLMARQGIEVLIWDQRGTGESKGEWYKSTYSDLVNDALAGIHLLQARPEVARNKVGVYGHSQGGTLSVALAGRSTDVAFVIAGAPIVGPVFEQDLFRVRNGLSKQQFTKQDIQAAMDFYTMWLNVARNGKGWDEMEARKQQVKGEKWFDWVEPPSKESYIWSYYPPVGNFNSLPDWQKLGVPTLVLYGERDAIEDIGAYSLRADQALRKAKNPDFTIAILPRALHELKVDNEPGSPYQWRHPSPGLYDLMIGWIKLRFDSGHAKNQQGGGSAWRSWSTCLWLGALQGLQVSDGLFIGQVVANMFRAEDKRLLEVEIGGEAWVCRFARISYLRHPLRDSWGYRLSKVVRARGPWVDRR